MSLSCTCLCRCWQPSRVAASLRYAHKLGGLRPRIRVVIRAADSGGEGGTSDGNQPESISLVRRFPGVGFTFMLAGTLKIATYFALMSGTPNGLTRTAAGKISPYLMAPVGLGLAYLAKHIVDNGLHESKRFIQFLVAGSIFLYFFLAKLLYRYEGPLSDLFLRRPATNTADAYWAGRNAPLQARIDEVDARLNSERRAPSRVQQYQDLEFYEAAVDESGAAGSAAADEARPAPSRKARAARPATRARRTYLSSDGEMSEMR